MYTTKITICSYLPISDVEYDFQPVCETFAEVERSRQSNLFTRVGSSARTTLFRLRRVSSLSPWSLIKTVEGSYLITEISPDPIFVTVTTARVQPILFSVRRSSDDCGRHVSAPPALEVIQFTGFLLPKYEGFTQSEPMATRKTKVVLATPKGFLLQTADIVERLDTNPMEKYILQTEDFLGEYQNEYGLYHEGDV